MITWLTSNIAGISIIGAVIAFVWSAIQFFDTRRRDMQFREFQVYHGLVKELLAGGKIDHQATIVFELRRFPSYYEFTARMLHRLREDWAAHPSSPRLLEEIDFTLAIVSPTSPNRVLKAATVTHTD